MLVPPGVVTVTLIMLSPWAGMSARIVVGEITVRRLTSSRSGPSLPGKAGPRDGDEIAARALLVDGSPVHRRRATGELMVNRSPGDRGCFRRDDGDVLICPGDSAGDRSVP